MLGRINRQPAVQCAAPEGALPHTSVGRIPRWESRQVVITHNHVVVECNMNSDSSAPNELSIELPSSLVGRRDQMFPQLSAAEVARIRPFGTLRGFYSGRELFAGG